MHQLDESLLEDGLLRACVCVVLCVCMRLYMLRDTLQIIFFHLLDYFVSMTGTIFCEAASIGTSLSFPSARPDEDDQLLKG